MKKPPLIILGVGRSGTTWVQRAFGHTGSFTTTRTAHDRLGVLAGGAALRCGLLTRPAEGYRLWRKRSPSLLVPIPRTDDWTLPADEAAGLRAAITSLGARHRAVLKCTAFNRNVPALRAATGECRIVCVWRDPVSVIDSLTEVAFWPTLRLWTRDGRMPMEFPVDEHRELARELWAAEATALTGALGAVPPTAVQHVVYEELVLDGSLLDVACRRLGLDERELAAIDLPEPIKRAGNGRRDWWSKVDELGDLAPSDHLSFLANGS